MAWIETLMAFLSTRWLLICAPLLVLAFDLLLFPVIFDRRISVKMVDITRLLMCRIISLGKLRTHRICVAIDSIRNSNFLSYIKVSRNALVISHFKDSSSSGSKAGVLGIAVVQKVREVSQSDGVKLQDQLNGIGNETSTVVEVALSIPKEQYNGFPIDHIFIVMLEEGPSGGDRPQLAKAMHELFKIAARRKISTLIVPSLGYNWQDKNTIEFVHFFRTVFDSMPPKPWPHTLLLLLYSGWPTHSLEDAVKSLNNEWQTRQQDWPVQLPGLYRADLRLILLFLFICLVASSLAAPMTLQNFLIISVAFLGSSEVSNRIINLLTKGYRPIVRFGIRLFVLLILAIGFPTFVTWKAETLFGA